MKTIQLGKIIENSNTSFNEFAKKLFPNNAYPERALQRIIKGEAVLDANQISTLSLMTGISINELFEGGEWKSRISNNLIISKNGEYQAELNLETWTTKLFKDGSYFHEMVISAKSCTLSEYINKLNRIINEN